MHERGGVSVVPRINRRSVWLQRHIPLVGLCLQATAKKVVRATFSAELMGACDSVDKGILLSQMLHEISTGDCSIDGARQGREHGGYCVPLVVYIDAMSVFAVVTASFIKIRADNGMLSHVQYMRELLDSRVVVAIGWTDTRGQMEPPKDQLTGGLLHTCMGETS